MRLTSRVFCLLALLALLALALPATALAGHTTDPRSPNLVPLGHIVEPRLTGGAGATTDIHTDLGFRGNLAIQGTWLGFNIRDISNPAAPTQVSYTSCPGNQGDVLVYRNIVVRSWNSPASATPGPAQNPLGRAETVCDGQPVAVGFEGLHVFDISNLADPRLVAQVPTPGGSHTATAVPDPANNRLLVYNAASSATFPQIDIVSVPLTAPQGATLIRSVPAGGACHDIQVMLGDTMLATCAGGNGFRVFSLGGPRGGSLDSPTLLYGVVVPTVTVGHSSSFSWNGEIIVFGWEPGGGTQAECEAVDDPLKKSLFFYRADDGAFLGTWVLPRPQSSNENCTLHNFNTVPFLNRHVLVHGSYQAGTSVVEFTNPAAPREIAWTDPAPEPIPTPGTPAYFCGTLIPPTPPRPVGCALGGAWGTYWYNGPLYETNIPEGLNLWRVAEPWWNRAVRFSHMNPQTQEALLTCEGRVRGPRLVAGRHATLRITLRALAVNADDSTTASPAVGVAIRLRGAGINRTLRTRASGRVSVSVHPMRAGALRLRASALNMSPCSTTVRVNRARRAGGGGAGGGAGGGLTGRLS
jgi:LVIVD repeat